MGGQYLKDMPQGSDIIGYHSICTIRNQSHIRCTGDIIDF